MPGRTGSTGDGDRERARLGPGQREAALRRMTDQVLDVLVIGGGITGAGVALDAAARGLSVGLVEAQDYAAGTSSRSSKLIHGGLRYLEQRNFALVREALRERTLLLSHLAPHLVRPVSFLYPLRHRVWERLYVGAGVLLYDTMGGARALPRHRHLSRRAALRLAPGLRPDALVGAIRYWDGQVDDARYVVTLARTAAGHGAALANSAQAVELLREGDRVVGARVRDLESDQEHQVLARQVVSATGVWTNELADQVGGGQFRVRMSKGVHFTVPRDRVPSGTGLILRTERSVLLVIPWGRHWIIGTTDTDWTLDQAEPVATRADIDYLLERVNQVLARPLTHDDVDSVYAGLRPLLASASVATTQLSREHAVFQPAPGLVMVAGGKLTTYRVMAKDTVDAVAEALGRPVPPSSTATIPLLGADGYQAAWQARQQLAAASGLDLARIEHLLIRYGTATDEVLELLATRPELATPIPGAGDYLAAEAVYAASHEGALHLEDVLLRRTRIAIETPDRGLVAAEPVAQLIGGVLGWDAEQVAREVGLYRARVDAEQAAETKPEDVSAERTRHRAPTVRALRSSPSR